MQIFRSNRALQARFARNTMSSSRMANRSASSPKGLDIQNVPEPFGADKTEESDESSMSTVCPSEMPRTFSKESDDGGMMTRSTRGAGSWGAPSTWWRIVWCHERCHKGECNERRKSMQSAANEAGAAIVCLKKAGKFHSWILSSKRPQPPPYVLLTDWREVKPCLKLLTQDTTRPFPAFVVVLCELRKHYERASAWAERASLHVCPVYVCGDVDSSKDLVDSIRSELIRSMADGTPPFDAMPPISKRHNAEAFRDLNSEEQEEEAEEHEEDEAFPALQDEDEGAKKGAKAGVWDFELLMKSLHGLTGDQIAHLLKTSTPDRYDD